MMWRTGFPACSVLIVALLAGCSSFNMAPSCDETGPGLQRHLVAPNSRVAPDYARLSELIEVSAIAEINSGYNYRICEAQIVALGQPRSVRYHVEQSEGVQGWYEIELLNLGEGGLADFIIELRAAYAN